MGNNVKVVRKALKDGAPGTRGVVHFIGETEFGNRNIANAKANANAKVNAKSNANANSVWIGVVLHSPDGLNDGSKNGVAYFRCKPMHGLFVQVCVCVFVHLCL